MSAAQTHPTTVRYPARSGFGAALALIALVALAIVAFAVGQSGLSVGPRAAAPAHGLADHRLQRVGEINTGAPDVPTSPTVDYWAGVESAQGIGTKAVAAPVPWMDDPGRWAVSKTQADALDAQLAGAQAEAAIRFGAEVDLQARLHQQAVDRLAAQAAANDAAYQNQVSSIAERERRIAVPNDRGDGGAFPYP